MKEIGKMRFNDLPIQVEIAKSVQPKYFKETDKIPKKYQNYYYDFIDGYLCELQNNTRVIKNEKEVGLPKYISIGANRIHLLAYSNNKRERAYVIKIKNTLKDYFLKRITPIYITNYPIHIEFKFYISEESKLDRDNLGLFYEKIFFDCIQTKLINEKNKIEINARGFIPNDDIKHINSATTKAFYTTKTPYLIVKFYEYENPKEFEDDRAGIKQNKNIMHSINKLAERFARINVNKTFKERELYIQGTDEYSIRVMNFYQREVDFFTEQLSNEFLTLNGTTNNIRTNSE